MCKVFISSAKVPFGHCPQTHLSATQTFPVFLPTLVPAKLDQASATHLPEFPTPHLLGTHCDTKDADNWLLYPCFLSGSPQTGISTLGSPSCP